MAGVSLVAIAAGVVVIQGSGGGTDDPDRYVFGQVAATSPGVTIRAGAGEGDERPLAPGDDVEAGSVLETTAGASASVDLAQGGALRVEGGARLVFVDLAADPQTGAAAARGQAGHPGRGRAGVAQPAGPGAIRGAGGGGNGRHHRPPGGDRLRPRVAVEAPAGGVTVTTRADGRSTPPRASS